MNMVIEMTTTVMIILTALSVPLLISMGVMALMMTNSYDDDGYDDPVFWGEQNVDRRKKLNADNDLCDTQ